MAMMFCACNRLAVDLIYMAGFMGLDAQCKMVVGTAPTTALAVGPFRGRGCERSELPYLVCDGGS